MSGRTTKRCPSPLHVGERELPAKEFAHAHMKTNGEPWCRACRAEWKRLRTKNYLALWWQENKDAQNAELRRKYAMDSEYRRKVDERNRKWQKENPEYERERYYRRKRDQPEYLRKMQQQFREANREEIRERQRRWVRSNKDANREHHARYNALRRTREKEAGGNVTLEKIRARWNYYGGMCWMCGKMATGMDHVKPVAKGGGSWASNLRPACNSCNAKKSAKWPWPTSMTG